MPEFLSEQERYENGVLPRELLIPLLGDLSVLPLIESEE